ncbi:MAG TPA: hypothetical protein DDW76_27700 [Cyanobacteria bacterium UBA11369]|nr:hypothetical protein [Cyanobacteria bacterium UBA11371]HBE30753.1 hypothetical protein [Cyanobacteria bacterium UBA11368]HBE52452.1 hypothetical protein [Cyanobacteria bacterium UBA11369]
MKSIVVPANLLGLPQPWCLSSNWKRQEQLQVLEANTKEIEKALAVLEYSLATLSQLTLPEGKSIPEDINDNWNFSIEWIANKIPIIDDFDIRGIEEFLKENKIESPSEQTIEDVADSWLWTMAFDIAATSSDWLEKILKTHEDSLAISRFLDIVTRYWHVTHRSLAGDLIITSARIAWADAIPLLESVEKTATDPSLQELAQSYRNMVLNEPNHWRK